MIFLKYTHNVFIETTHSIKLDDVHLSLHRAWWSSSWKTRNLKSLMSSCDGSRMGLRKGGRARVTHLSTFSLGRSLQGVTFLPLFVLGDQEYVSANYAGVKREGWD